MPALLLQLVTSCCANFLLRLLVEVTQPASASHQSQTFGLVAALLIFRQYMSHFVFQVVRSLMNFTKQLSQQVGVITALQGYVRTIIQTTTVHSYSIWMTTTSRLSVVILNK